MRLQAHEQPYALDPRPIQHPSVLSPRREPNEVADEDESVCSRVGRHRLRRRKPEQLIPTSCIAGDSIWKSLPEAFPEPHPSESSSSAPASRQPALRQESSHLLQEAHAGSEGQARQHATAFPA